VEDATAPVVEIASDATAPAAQAVGAIGPEAENVGTKADMEPPPEVVEGEDSLWLSSIMTDGEDEEVE